MYLATGILLLHTFIPHSHSEELQDHVALSCDNCENCILEFLEIILDHDFGEYHLEHFQTGNNDLDDFNKSFVLTKIIDTGIFIKEAVEDNSVIYVQPYAFPPDKVLQPDRGPPIFS